MKKLWVANEKETGNDEDEISEIRLPFKLQLPLNTDQEKLCESLITGEFAVKTFASRN